MVKKVGDVDMTISISPTFFMEYIILDIRKDKCPIVLFKKPLLGVA